MTSAARVRPQMAVTVADIRARAAALAADVGPSSAARDAERQLPFEIFRAVRSDRIGTLRVPAHLGGPGGSVADVIETVAALAAGEPNVAHALRSHFNFVELAVATRGGAKPSVHLDRVLAGDLYAGAHTERGTARAGEIATRLSRTADGWRLNGVKHYATGTAFADWASISALDDDGQVRRVLLPVTRPGVRILDDWDGMGQRLTASGGVVLDDVAVFADEIGTRPNDTFAGRHASTFRQLYLAAVQAGIVRNVEADALAYVQRISRPIAHGHAATAREDHFVQQAVGRIAAHRFAVDALVAAAAANLDPAAVAIVDGIGDVDAILTDSAATTAKAQTVIGRLALEAAELIFDTGGATATGRALNLDRHWRNIRTLLSHNPTAYKHKVVGDLLLNGTGLPVDGGFF